MSDNLCKNCKHCIVDDLGYEYAKCGLVKIENRRDLVDGTPSPKFGFCEIQRTYAWEQNCGPAGKHFEPK
jgi:hypothetical protein